jgi:crotonobetainyl-CoA:carnitine CoA-transferase CaiB-like acyl-CoA transferase
MIPEIAAVLRTWPARELAAALERLDLPFAPVNKPGDLFHDAHLLASGGLADIRMTDGRPARTPLLPVSLDGRRLANRRDPPQIGEHSREVLEEIGLEPDEIGALRDDSIVAAPA